MYGRIRDALLDRQGVAVEGELLVHFETSLEVENPNDEADALDETALLEIDQQLAGLHRDTIVHAR